MGGFFGAAAHHDVVLDVFFGVDYHSHLGTKCAGMIFHDAEEGCFQREIHSIENTPFRTRFEDDLQGFHGCSGIGCISDTDPQPLLVRSHLARSASPRWAPSTTPRSWWRRTSPAAAGSSWP